MSISASYSVSISISISVFCICMPYPYSYLRISSRNLPGTKITDDFFARDAKKKTKKTESGFFATDEKKAALSDEKKTAQKEADKAAEFHAGAPGPTGALKGINREYMYNIHT